MSLRAHPHRSPGGDGQATPVVVKESQDVRDKPPTTMWEPRGGFQRYPRSETRQAMSALTALTVLCITGPLNVRTTRCAGRPEGAPWMAEAVMELGVASLLFRPEDVQDAKRSLRPQDVNRAPPAEERDAGVQPALGPVWIVTPEAFSQPFDLREHAQPAALCTVGIRPAAFGLPARDSTAAHSQHLRKRFLRQVKLTPDHSDVSGRAPRRGGDRRKDGGRCYLHHANTPLMVP